MTHIELIYKTIFDSLRATGDITDIQFLDGSTYEITTTSTEYLKLNDFPSTTSTNADPDP